MNSSAYIVLLFNIKCLLKNYMTGIVKKLQKISNKYLKFLIFITKNQCILLFNLLDY